MIELHWQQVAWMWESPKNLRLLREVTYYYLYKSSTQEGGKPLSQLAKEIIVHLGPPNERVQKKLERQLYDALRRFMYFETLAPQNTSWYDALLRVVVDWFRQNHDKGEAADTHYLAKMRSAGWLEAGVHDHGQVTPAGTQVELSGAAIELFKTYFRVYDQQFEQASRLLTGRFRCNGIAPTNEDRQGYNAYRYGVTPGVVVKSFVLITPPSDLFPYCSFRAFYKNEDSQVERQSRGVVFSLPHAIYCVGRINDGDAFEVLSLPGVTEKAGLHAGLILTVGDNGRPLVSRVVLEKTAAKHSDDAELWVREQSSILSELSKSIVQRMRNYIEFSADKLIVEKETGRPLRTSEMVARVEDLTRQVFEMEGKPFNPASHDHYPFNQALLPFSPGK